MKIVALPVLITFLSVFTLSSSARTKTLDLGGVLVSVSDLRTAQVFHIVDQMSQWDDGVHHEYVRWATRTLNLTQEDQQLLQKHAGLRRARGWGNGFEQTFYVDFSIEDAAQRGVDRKLLSPDEAASEKTILLHAAESVGLSWDELNEGIAHAFSPGLTDNPQQSDSLAERLARNFQRGISASDGYAQSKKYIVR